MTTNINQAVDTTDFEPEWIITDLHNLGNTVATKFAKKYTLITQIEILQGRMTPEELASEGGKLIEMDRQLAEEVRDLTEKLGKLKEAMPTSRLC